MSSEPDRKMPGCQWINGMWIPLPARPALWEYGAEILVRIDERDVTIHNGVDVLAVWGNL